MPPAAAEPPDTEVLDGAPFMSGGWPDESISFWTLDVGSVDVASPAESAYIGASAAANIAAQRRAVMGVIVAKDGKLMLLRRFNERLPGAAGGTVDCTAFPGLAKLAPGAAGQQVPEERIQALAEQLQVELPATADLSEGARAKWIWGLSRLSRSLTA